MGKGKTTIKFVPEPRHNHKYYLFFILLTPPEETVSLNLYNVSHKNCKFIKFINIIWKTYRIIWILERNNHLVVNFFFLAIEEVDDDVLDVSGEGEVHPGGGTVDAVPPRGAISPQNRHFIYWKQRRNGRNQLTRQQDPHGGHVAFEHVSYLSLIE